VSHSGCFILLSLSQAYVNYLDIDLARNTPWVDMSACVKFRLDRPSRLAGHTEQTDKHIAFYYVDYLVPRRLSTDPKIRDLEWLWMDWRAILRYTFTIMNCHWLIICYLFTVFCLLHVWPTPEPCDQRRSVGSGVANSDPQNIWNLRKIRGRYIVGTLTNNTNIII